MLHEYRLIVELQPGQAVIFPSALITQCNIPLQPGDERYSIVLYSAGGLYRYVAYGCRTWAEFVSTDPVGTKAFEEQHVVCWNTCWDGMARVPDLEKIWHLKL